MTRRLRLLRIGLAAMAVLGAVLCLYRIRNQTLPSLAASQSGHLVGAFHLHTNDSHDSSITVEEMAAAARQNSLDFIIITDHNKQKPSALSIGGVTVLSYAELSTPQGHVVGLGANYTLDRSLRDDPAVLRHLRAAGGLPVLTHPTDLKRPWAGSPAGAQGVEIANLAAAARRAARPAFLGMLPLLVAWPLNPSLVMAQLLERDAASLALWDAEPDPLFIGLCGTDVHGWIPLALNMRAWYVILDAPAASENRPQAILTALHEGRFHCASGLLGRDPTFSFGARRQGLPAGHMGETVRADVMDELVATAPSTSVGPTQIVLLRDGKDVTRTVGNTLRMPVPEPGTYRVEVRVLMPNLLVGSRWEAVIYSNRLRVVQPPLALPPGAPRP